MKFQKTWSRSLSIGLFVLIMVSFQTGLQASPDDALNVLSVKYTFPAIGIETGGGSARLEIAGCRLWNQPGEPVVPVRCARVLLPPGHTVGEAVIRVIEPAATQVIDSRLEWGRNPLPKSGESLASFNAAVATPPDLAIYGSDRPFPGSRVSFKGVQRWCGYDIAILDLFPVLYRPKSGAVVSCTTLEVDLTLVPVPREPDAGALPHTGRNAHLIRDFVDNPEMLTCYAASGSNSRTGNSAEYDYLLVSSNNLLSAFQPLVEQKENDGLRVVTESMEDVRVHYSGSDDAQKLRQCIRQMYLEHGIRYVLLGGDVALIPTRGVYGYSQGAVARADDEYTTVNMPCDMYFACLDGPWDGDGDGIWGEPNDGEGGGDVDLLAEVYLGRAPVETVQEVNVFVDKVVDYEEEGQVNHDNALFLAEYLGYYDGDHAQGGDALDLVGDHFEAFEVEWLDDRPYTASTWGRTACLEALNRSPHLVAHDGHAYVRYALRMENQDVASLNNDGLFLVNSTGCYCGAFDNQDCIAEEFIKRPDHGAFAVIMNSRYGWFDPANAFIFSGEFQKALFDNLLDQGHEDIGAANQLAKHDLVGSVETTGSMTYRWCYFEITLFGDPHLRVLNPAPNTSIVSGPEGTVDSPVLTFTFTGSDSFDPPEGLFYSYCLDGTGWSPYDSATRATFSGLSSGSHTFMVCARNSDGVTDPTPAERPFIVEAWDDGPLWLNVVTGPGPSPANPPLVRTALGQWLAYGVNAYGVNVACGDLDGSGYDEVITAPGPGAPFGPHIRAWQRDGTPLPAVSYLAYGTHRYGANVVSGDIDGDGMDEIITGAGPGAVFGPHVRAWNCDGGPAVPVGAVSFLAYGTHRYGVNVACGDIDGDGIDEIVTGAGPGAVFGPHVRGWNHDGSSSCPSMGEVNYFAYGTPRWGVNVACGDIDGNGSDEIITGPGPGSVFGAHVRAWSCGSGTVEPVPGVSYFAYQSSCGVVVSAADVDGDGRDEILTMPGPDPVSGAHLRAWNAGGGAVTPVEGLDFSAYDSWMAHGGRIAGGNLQ